MLFGGLYLQLGGLGCVFFAGPRWQLSVPWRMTLKDHQRKPVLMKVFLNTLQPPHHHIHTILMVKPLLLACTKVTVRSLLHLDTEDASEPEAVRIELEESMRNK